MGEESYAYLEWVEKKEYDIDDIILYDNEIYKCFESHTSGEEFALDEHKWLNVSDKYFVIKTHGYINYTSDDELEYIYYRYTPDSKPKYEQVKNETHRTGELVIPMANRESKFKMNIYNVIKCLFVEDIIIDDWFSKYMDLIETTGYYTDGDYDEDRENRVIYCRDKDSNYKYYKLTHEFNDEWADTEPAWAIINEEGHLWNPEQIYNYYFPELDECNQPTGRYFVREKDMNPTSPTYTYIRITEIKVTEGIIRTERDGEYSNRYIKPKGYKTKDDKGEVVDIDLTKTEGWSTDI